MIGENQYILKSILKFESGLLFTLIHIVLGFLATISPIPIIAWYYLLILDTMRAFVFVHSKERNLLLAHAIVYFASFELLGRMSSSSPYIPYESSKYLVMLLAIVGILLNLKEIKISHIGFWLFILLIPSLFFDESGQVKFSDIVFNLFGLFNIAFAITFFSIIRVNKWGFLKWIRLIALPAVPILVYTFLKTPDYSELEFELSANFDTTGGFGSNQVSTVLGLGSFLFAIALILNYRITSNKIFDLIFLIGFTIQGLLTFSRGGMIGTVVGIITLIYFLLKLGKTELRRLKIPNPKKYILPTVAAFVFLFILGNIITSGNLALRYQGQTEGTIAGSQKVSLNKLTSNRYALMLEDFVVWFDNPIFGAGAGASKFLRNNTKLLVSHVEFSRLIAEHGLLGIIIIGLFVRMYFIIRDSKTDKLNKAIQMSFFILGVFTSFHAATRTFFTPLLISLSFVNIVDSSNNQPIKKSEKPKFKQPIHSAQI